MASPYSDDLRQKAIDAVDRGERKSHVCKMLNISRNTLDLWLLSQRHLAARHKHSNAAGAQKLLVLSSRLFADADLSHSVIFT